MLRSALALAIVLGLPAAARTFTAQVVRVADGDSMTVRDAGGHTHEIRILGIDAPERDQPWARESRASLERMLSGQTVTIDAGDVDPWGRLVARVLRDARDPALAQLEAGLAWTYPWADGLASASKASYAAAERRARETRTGLWRDPSPVPPWTHRRERRAPRRAAAAGGPVIGNRVSRIYHHPGCPGYAAVSARNRVPFASAAEAEKAGYRMAGNCP